jgi:hypothetical protein
VGIWPGTPLVVHTRDAPHAIERPVFGGSQKIHRRQDQWQLPRLPNFRGQNGVDNAILSRRPRSHNQDARWSVEVPRGASAGKVTMVRHELCPERRRSNRTAIKLQEEAVFVSAQTEYPVPVWPQAPMSAGGRVAPLHQRTAALHTRCARQHSKDCVGSHCVVEVGQEGTARTDG